MYLPGAPRRTPATDQDLGHLGHEPLRSHYRALWWTTSGPGTVNEVAATVSSTTRTVSPPGAQELPLLRVGDGTGKTGGPLSMLASSTVHSC